MSRQTRSTYTEYAGQTLAADRALEDCRIRVADLKQSIADETFALGKAKSQHNERKETKISTQLGSLMDKLTAKEATLRSLEASARACATHRGAASSVGSNFPNVSVMAS